MSTRSKLDRLFPYSVGTAVVVHDFRLGMTYWVCVAALIVFFSITQIQYEKSHLKRLTTLPSITMSFGGYGSYGGSENFYPPLYKLGSKPQELYSPPKVSALESFAPFYRMNVETGTSSSFVLEKNLTASLHFPLAIAHNLDDIDTTNNKGLLIYNRSICTALEDYISNSNVSSMDTFFGLKEFNGEQDLLNLGKFIKVKYDEFPTPLRIIKDDTTPVQCIVMSPTSDATADAGLEGFDLSSFDFFTTQLLLIAAGVDLHSVRKSKAGVELPLYQQGIKLRLKVVYSNAVDPYTGSMSLFPQSPYYFYTIKWENATKWVFNADVKSFEEQFNSVGVSLVVDSESMMYRFDMVTAALFVLAFFGFLDLLLLILHQVVFRFIPGWDIVLETASQHLKRPAILRKLELHNQQSILDRYGIWTRKPDSHKFNPNDSLLDRA